jgi:3-deoxy-7-phosphoheptulonate synthase
MKPIKQQPEYKDQEALKKALTKVSQLPPLVHVKEIEALKERLAAAAEGKMFLIQGGDCAESFADCSKQPIENKFKILLQMSLILVWSARVPVVRIGRLAGQFAKPRTSTFETVNGKKVYSFKGDNVNDIDVEKREPDPERLVAAYFHSAATLNYVRAMILGGVADLHHPRSWMLENIKDSHVKKEYETLIDRLCDSINFLNAINSDGGDSLKSVEFFTSHEGLILDYEEALTAKYNVRDRDYNMGAHFLWIGDRTRDIDGAHVEYFRGIANPVGVKVGPSMKADELIQLVQVLNPNKEPGKITLITRYGAAKVQEILPGHIRAVKESGIPVLWVCDPCHGNTESTESGLKTRRVEKIIAEIIETFRVHSENGSRLGGVHLELTGDDVTECIGGSPDLLEHALSTNYETLCDPRLNYTQSLDIAFVIANQLKNIAKR